MKAARAWFDGAARGNPGEAGFGLVVESDGEVEELGGYLGLSRENVSRQLGHLKHANMLRIDGSQIIIADERGLAEIATDPSKN